MHATLPAADGVDPTRVLPHHGSNVAPLPLEDKAACLLLYHGRRRRHFNSCRHTAAETRTEQFQERYWERRGVDENAWNCLVSAGCASPIAAIQVPSLAVSTQRETGLLVCNVVDVWRSNRGTATMMAQLASQRQYCPQVVRGAQLEPACPNTASVFDSLYCRLFLLALCMGELSNE